MSEQRKNTSKQVVLIGDIHFSNSANFIKIAETLRTGGFDVIIDEASSLYPGHTQTIEESLRGMQLVRDVEKTNQHGWYNQFHGKKNQRWK